VELRATAFSRREPPRRADEDLTMNLKQALSVVLLVSASIGAAGAARADDEICALVVFYKQTDYATIYRAVHFGSIDVVTTEDRFVFVTRVFVDPQDLVPLNSNQEFACVP
jgi:hypothetical protein